MKRSLMILCCLLLACGGDESESTEIGTDLTESGETSGESEITPSIDGDEVAATLPCDRTDGACDESESIPSNGSDEVAAPLPCDRIDGICDVTIPLEFGPAFRISELAIGADGTTGQSLNIDPEAGDDDCSPPGKCENGGDNALSSLGGFANDGLADALANGNLMILGSALGDLEGTFNIEMYSGSSADPSCAFQTDACAYNISSTSYDCGCQLRAKMEGTITDGKLMAGGDDATFKFTFPIDEDTLDLTAVRAQMMADAEITDEGLVLTNVIIGGSIKQSTLIQTINDHPADTFGPISKDTIIQVIESIAPDIDTDGDGEDDGLSVGLTGATIPASFTGDLVD